MPTAGTVKSGSLDVDEQVAQRGGCEVDLLELDLGVLLPLCRNNLTNKIA